MLENSRETPADHPKGIREGSSQKVKRLPSLMKCLFTNACCMGNKQEEHGTIRKLGPNCYDRNMVERVTGLEHCN